MAKKKKNSSVPVVIAVVIFILLLGAGYFSFKSYLLKRQLTITNLSTLFGKYTDYSVKDDNVYFKNKVMTNTTLFTDSKLEITFLYPKNFYLKSGLEPGTNPRLLIGMTNTPNSKYYPEDTMTQKDYIDSDINCRIDPNAGGICSEGFAPWLDISITENPDIQKFNKTGDVEDLGKFTSVSERIVNIDRSYVNRYSVLYQQNSKNFVVSITSKTDLAENEGYSYAIWLLLNSFRVN